MAITSPGVVGLTRSEQQARSLDTVNQGLQVLGQLKESQRQFNVVEGMKNVLNGADIATVLMTDEGRAALAPFVGDLTGLNGDRLATYMDMLAKSPRTAEALYQQVTSGELMGLTGLQGGAPVESEADYLKRTVSFTPPATEGTPPPARTPAPALTSTPGPAFGGLNADELQTLQQLANAQITEFTPPQDPRARGPNPATFTSPLIPGKVFRDRQEATTAVQQQMFAILGSGSREARDLWAQVRAGVPTEELARPDIGRRAQGPTFEGPSSVGRTYDAVFGKPGEATMAASTPAAPAPAAATPAPAAATPGTPPAPPASFKQFLLDYQANVPESERPASYRPISESGTWTDAQYRDAAPGLYREFELWQRGRAPAWAGTPASAPQTGSASQGAATVGQGTLSREDELIQKYYMMTYAPRVDGVAPPAMSSAEVTEAKRLISARMAKDVATTRREWRATPGLQGAAAGAGERISAILQRVAPGVRAEDHPILAETRVNWADLTKRKTEAEIASALADAGLKQTEAKYYLAKLQTDAALKGIEQLAVSSESYAKALGEARQLLGSLYGEEYKQIAAIKDPDARARAEAALMERPVFKSLWSMTVDGLAVLSGNAVSKELYEVVKQGLFRAAESTAVPVLETGSTTGDAAVTGETDAAAEAAGYAGPGF